MDGNYENRRVCCFCGETVFLKDSVIMTIQPNVTNIEQQQLFCHRHCLIKSVHKSIILHPDIFS
jgi:hypothetical protein